MDTRKMLLRFGVTAIGLIAALHLNIDILFAQRARRAFNFPVAANAMPPGVTVRERTENARAAADDERPISFRGLVRDIDHRPVAGATVWLVSYRSERRDQTTIASPIETLTDAAGRFSFGEVDEQTFFRTETSWGSAAPTMAVARDAQGRIGWHYVHRSLQVNRECEIHLREAIQFTGRVLDGQAKPLAGARLTPQELLARPPGEDRALSDHLMLFPALAAEFSTLTAADGSFRLSGVPRCDYVECRLAARGVEKAIVWLKAGEEAVIRVGLPGKITGSLPLADQAMTDADRKAMIGHRLQISLEGPAKPLPSLLPLQFYGTAVVGERGRFEFDGLPPGRYTIASTHLENVPYYAGPAEIEVKEGQHVGGVSIRLTKLRQVTGRVVDRETGQGIPAVEMIGMSTSPYLRLRAKSDAEGRFSFWLTPGEARLVVDRVPPEYLPSPDLNGTTHDVPDGQWPLTQLERAATLEGRVVDDAGKPVPFARVAIDSAHGNAKQPPVPYRCDREGKFKASQLSRSEPVSLRARTSTASVPSPVVVTPSEVDAPIELVISEKGACSISGRVVDQTGLPLPLAGVSLVEQRSSPPTANGTMASYGATSYLSLTADGRFETEALWPGVQYQLRISALGYADHYGAFIQGEAGKEYDFGAIALEPLRLITGEVVDDQGRPVPGAELRVDLPEGSAGAGAKPLEMQSDKSGWFALTRVVNDGTLKVWARAGGATTDGGQLFVTREIERRLRIVVAEANACHLTGKVIDGDGHPVPTARVSVVWECDLEANPTNRFSARRYQRRRSNGRSELQVVLADHRPGEDGAFTTGPLWRGEHYHLRITADGHETVELPVILGGRDTNAQAGPIVLRRANRSLEGTVVDAAGQPLIYATVINSGDAEKVLMARTDAAGRFRLDGLFEGEVYVLVRKDGYWPAGWRGPAGQHGQRIALTAVDQPRPASRLPEAGDRSPHEREVVRRLLSELWQRREKMIADGAAPRRVRAFAAPAGARGFPVARQNAAPNAVLHGELVALMAAVDPDLASQWSASEGNQFDADVRRGLARRAGAGDISAETGPGLLVAIAKRRSAAGLRDEAVRLLEDALQIAPVAEAAQPQSDLICKAQIGTAAIAAGSDEWGRSLVREAADRLEELGGANATLQARGEVAVALAGFDAPRALRVWELQPLPPPNDRFHYGVRLAVNLAYSDPQAALRLASEPLNVNYDDVVIEIACRVAEHDTDQAIEIIDKRITELPNDARLFKALALRRIAVAIAPRQRSRAYDLIDRALGLCLPTDPPGTWRTWGNAAERAARIAVAAGELGHPDMPTVVDFVLASRLSPSEFPAARARLEPIYTARLLALVDPATARELLGHVPRPSDIIDTREGDRLLAEWLQAWALIDLDRAEKLFRDILAEQDLQLTAKCIQTNLLPMLELLATPRAERGALISRETVLP